VGVTLEVGEGKPYATIQSAINATSNGDTVLVYYNSDYYHFEDINFLGKAITVKAVNGPEKTIIGGGYYNVVTFENGEGPGSILDGFYIYSGMKRGIYCNGSSPTITNCIISGDNDSIGIYCSNADPTITNCTIRNNYGSYGYPYAHGGIYCENLSSPTIDNCTITRNWSGIYSVSSRALIKNCTITQNSSGGIRSEGPVHPTITDCTITGNSAGYGGGIDSLTRFGDDPPVITNCTITGNSAVSSGGGIAIRHEGLNMSPLSTYITNCSITGNSSQYGGGMYFSETTHPKITNCTIAGNKATASGGGICSYSLWGPRLTNSILWGNDAPNDKQMYQMFGSISVTYSDIEGGWTGTGNIAIDPQFVMPGYWYIHPYYQVYAWMPGDYHLQSVSPCIDSGTSDYAPATDIAGTPRPQGAGDDMGAYEFSTDSDNDGLFDWQDNCPAVCNPQQLDADNDGIGDVCDTTQGCCTGCGQVQCEPECPPPSSTTTIPTTSSSTTTSIPDTDSDGFLDNADNCPTICNSQQLDADSDNVGDVCDLDPGCGGCSNTACETAC
jgi:parallel beta-helix repeat protein